MALLIPSSSGRHEPLPSLPPSPTEEDLTSAWNEVGDEEYANHENLMPSSAPGSSLRKGKGKDLNEEDSLAPVEGSNGYPPTHEDEEESRKVEENLKRWELAERQRRKAMREAASASTPTTIVGDVGRRASLLWPGRKSNRPQHGGVGAHRALNTTETDDAVPLDEIEGGPSPAVSVPASPTPSDHAEMNTRVPLDNPFENAVVGDPFEDSQKSAVMDASSLPPTPAAREEKRPSSREPVVLSDRPLLQASTSFSKQPPPPPQPLNIPPPRTPPPRMSTPAANRPPEPAAPQAMNEVEREADHPPSRWWTDWLCGCREDSDRGDNQAGRTNPFE